MSTWDAVWAGLIHILEPTAFLYMMLGIVISSTLVALPGIGSKTAIALLLPLAFTLDKFEASNLSSVNARGSKRAIAVLDPIPGSATRVELITIPSIM